MIECLFCKIVDKKIPAEIVYEDKKIIAFKDINPKAKIHILIIPKKHIESLNFIQEIDRKLMAELFFVIKKIAKNNNLDNYRLQINNGKKAGQEIDHLHIHILSN
jgi:histidine triad (HIT) family protein